MKQRLETWLVLCPLMVPLMVSGFAWVAYRELGRYPFYMHPDPADIFHEAYYGPGILFLQLAFFVSLYNIVRAGILIRSSPKRALAFFSISLLSYVWAYMDPAGLLKWFMD